MGPFIPTGTVTFYDGGIALSPTKSLINGQATFTAIWSSGNHSITASYGGDSNFNSCGPSQALNLSIGNYLVSSWLTPINGFTPEATNYSNEIRQFLGTHFDIPIYDGLPLNPNPILDLGTIDQLVRTFPGLNGIIVDQPFVAPAAELDRIELQLFALNGQGSDVLVQIFADSSGVPTGSPLVSVTVPREAILGVTSPNIPVLTEPTSLMSTSSVNSNGRLDTLASLYDITTSLWSSDNTPPNLNPLPPADSSSTPIWFFGSCSTGQAIVEAGGYIGAATGSTNTGLIGAGGISVWQNWGDLPTPLFYNSLAYTGGQVLCVGGCTDSDNSTSSTFTTTLDDTGALGSWSTGPTLPQALGMCGVAASQSIPGYGAAVYVIGGVVNGSSDVVSQNCVYMTQYNNSSLSEFTDVPVNYFLMV